MLVLQPLSQFQKWTLGYRIHQGISFIHDDLEVFNLITFPQVPLPRTLMRLKSSIPISLTYLLRQKIVVARFFVTERAVLTSSISNMVISVVGRDLLNFFWISYVVVVYQMRLSSSVNWNGNLEKLYLQNISQSMKRRVSRLLEY